MKYLKLGVQFNQYLLTQEVAQFGSLVYYGERQNGHNYINNLKFDGGYFGINAKL